MKNKAFTLIEMLVVISLIGILAGMALISFTSSQRQARDVNRKSDLKQYQTATENYATKNNGAYPISINAQEIEKDSQLCTTLGIGTCPLDPKNPDYKYQYQSDSNGANYIFWSILESKTTDSTTTYWIVCSNGKNAEYSVGTPNLTICSSI